MAFHYDVLRIYKKTKQKKKQNSLKWFFRPKSNGGDLGSLCSSCPRPEVERLEQRSGVEPTRCKGYN